MNFKQLRAFQEVMLSGSVSEAARKLHRTQPAVTSLLKGLEQDLEMPLFERRGGRLQPLPEAHYLLGQADDILNRLTQTRRAMRSVREQHRGSVNIVCMPGPSVFVLPDIIARFVEQRPDVGFSLVTRSSSQVQQLVSVQQCDLGLMDLGLQLKSETDQSLFDQQVFEHSCYCAMRADDVLAAHGSINPALLDGKPMAMLYTSHPTHSNVAAVFKQHGCDLNVRFETQYFIPQCTFVERGLCYALMDAMSVHSYELYSKGSGSLVFIPFKPTLPHHVALLRPTHRKLSRLANSFYEHLRDYLQGLHQRT